MYKKKDLKALLYKFHLALTKEPENLDYVENLLLVLITLKYFDQAEKLIQKYLNYCPNNLKVLNMAFKVYLFSEQLDKSIKTGELLCSNFPGNPEFELQLAFEYLKNRQFNKGWQLYEARKKIQSVNLPEFFKNEWQGEKDFSKTLLIYPEQGFGDFFNFLPFIKYARKRVGKVILGCHPYLYDLLSRLDLPFIDQISQDKNFSNFNFYASLMSLPYILGLDEKKLFNIDLIKFSTKQPSWLKGIMQTENLNIGCFWRGRRKENDQRKCPVDFFANLKKNNPDINMLSLQKEVNNTEKKLLLKAGITDCSLYLASFADTAELLTRLDCLITIDSGIAHLAGILGVKTFLLLAERPWRYYYDSEKVVWYKNTKLFRQESAADWALVFNKINLELKK